MTYTIANRHNASYGQEQVRWTVPAGTITKIAGWAVPDGIHFDLGLPTHCDAYLTPSGLWAVTLEDAIALSETPVIDENEYTDYAEDFLADNGFDALDTYSADAMHREVLRQADLSIDDNDPDGQNESLSLYHHGKFVAYIWHRDRQYHLNGWMFNGNFETEELAAIEWLRVTDSAALDRAQHAAMMICPECQSLPDYN